MFDILALIATLTVITSLRKLIVVLPSLIGCMFRAKENINLEASVKHSIDRDICAVTMILPFCLAAYRFGIYDISPLQSLGENLRLAAYIGIFLAYILVRAAAARVTYPKKLNQKTRKAAGRISFIFHNSDLVRPWSRQRDDVLRSGPRGGQERNHLDISSHICPDAHKKIRNFLFFLLGFRRIFVPLRPRNFSDWNASGSSINFLG